MRKLAVSILIILLISLIISSIAIAKNSQPQSVEDKINTEGSAKVIVIIKDTQASNSKNKVAVARNLESKRTIAIQSIDDEITNKKDLQIINGFSGELTKRGLSKLKRSGVEYEIFEDVKIQLAPIKENGPTTSLDVSTRVTGANWTWENLNYTGRGIKIAVIDTGIDYTHESLGQCNPKIVNLTGTVEYLNETTEEIVNTTEYYNNNTIESDHNYKNNYHYQWNITMPGYTNIALHFDTMYGESGYDAIRILDGSDVEIASYKGARTDVWTPQATGDTIKIDWTTDSSINDTGIIIDAVINGTTNTTYNWSLCSKVKGGYDFIDQDDDPIDNNKHGTHVAGIISANGTIRGIAPDSELYALKACDRNGACDQSSILASLQWAIDNNMDIASISISGAITDESISNTGKYTMSEAVDTAVNSGLIVAVAAGNAGPGTSTIGYPGDSLKAITVGALNDAGTISEADDSVATYSTRGPSAFGRFDPEIIAPGSSITSTVLNNGTESISGTSMATPHVTGAIALLLEHNSSYSPMQVRALLLNSAKNTTGKMFDKGTGMLDIINLIQNNALIEVYAENSYGQLKTNDRWEFIADITGTSNSTITIINNNNFEVNFTNEIWVFDNKETSDTLSGSDFQTPTLIVVPANSNVSTTINYTISDYANTYKTTYGGIIRFLGTGNSSTINLSLPVAVTIPLTGSNYLTKTMYYEQSDGDAYIGDGDHYFYAYKTSQPANATFKINFSSTLDVIYFGIYNSTGSNIYRNESVGNNVQVDGTTANSDLVRWINVYANNTATPFIFTLNTTNDIYNNTPPTILNVTNETGQANYSFARPTNITLVLNYYDADGDILTTTINDSDYTKYNETNYTQTIYYQDITNTCKNNHSVKFTVIDSEVTSDNTTINVTIINPVDYNPILLSTYPVVTIINVSENETQIFNTSTCDVNDYSLTYYWYLNNTNVSGASSYTLNSSNQTTGQYNLTLVVANGLSNSTNEWTLNIQPNSAPTINNVTNSTGQDSLTFTRGGTILLKVNYTDAEEDAVNVTINDSTYALENNTNNIATFSWNTTTTCTNNHSILITATDENGASVNTTKNITILNPTDYPPIILTKSPSAYPVINIGSTQVFSLTTCDVNNYDLDYYWYINNTLNETTTNLTVNGSNLLNRSTNITIIVSNNQSNSSYDWNATTNNPVTYNDSKIISGYEWEKGSSKSNAFNISIFFYDLDNDTITYVLQNANQTNMTVASNGLVTFSSVSSFSGSEDVYIRASDSNSIDDSNAFTLTVTEADTSGDTGGTTGGGGGGAGGSSTPNYYSELFTGSKNRITMEGDLSTVSINKLEIDLKKEQNEVRLMVEQLSESDEPSYMTKFKGTKYSVLEITHDGLENEDISKATITFKVSKTWLQEQGIKTSNIKLYRYDDKIWNELTTKYKGTLGDNYIFEATSPGLSTFIVGHSEIKAPTITGAAISNTENSETTNEPEANIDENNLIGAGNTNTTNNTQIINTDFSNNIVVIISLIVIGIIIAVALFVIIKKPGDAKRPLKPVVQVKKEHSYLNTYKPAERNTEVKTYVEKRSKPNIDEKQYLYSLKQKMQQKLEMEKEKVIPPRKPQQRTEIQQTKPLPLTPSEERKRRILFNRRSGNEYKHTKIEIEDEDEY